MLLDTVLQRLWYACRPQRVQCLGRLGAPAAERARDAAAVAHGHRAPLFVGWRPPVCCRARPWAGEDLMQCVMHQSCSCLEVSWLHADMQTAAFK